jgi:tRNA A-37 threonylcarbamoyl transferase component Bud32/tetratricopeptide (TPR) repeat protein
MAATVNAELVASRYQVLNPIGQGGMGQVYLAVDQTLKRRVALKSIRADRRLDLDARARFIREARVLSQLDHPHICRVHDYLSTPEGDWIVLEYVQGVTLRAAMRAGLAAAQRLPIARQIAAVLATTHAAGVVHRDLKPGNVMLNANGDVKVLDFGLSATLPQAAVGGARSMDHASAQNIADQVTMEETRLPARVAPAPVDVSHWPSEAGSIKGTIAYMSPEQARGEAVTPASDMYSFGLLLQELFSGRAPYGDEPDSREVLARAQRGESLPPSDMPASILALVQRLKAMAPAERPTALDTRERLDWIADAPRRLRRNLAIAALVAIAVAGAVRYTLDLSRERNVAIAARDEATRRRGQAESLISFMVGDLRTKLAAVGRLEILDDVGKQALNYFAAVPAETLTNDELFRRSEALHQLGQVRQARADLDGAQTVVTRDPDNAQWQLGLGSSHFYVGDLRMRRGELDQALSHFQAYKRIAEALVKKEPKNFTYRLELSYGHSNVAAIHSRHGNRAGARDELERVVAIQGELLAERPDDAPLLNSRANTFNRLAIVLDGLGDLEGAAALFARELAAYEPILAKDPRDSRVRRRREVSHNFRGGVMKALGRSDEAAAHYTAAISEAQALVALDPTNANWQRDLGVGQMSAARVHLDAGRLDQARRGFSAALAVFETLAQKTAAQPGPQRDLIRAHLGLAETAFAGGNPETARRSADAAKAILDPVLSQHSDDPETRRDMALIENLRGVILASRKDPHGAQAAWQHSIALLEPLVAATTDRTLLDPWVRALLYARRVDDAALAHQKLLSRGYRDPSYLRVWQQHGAAGVSRAAQP